MLFHRRAKLKRGVHRMFLILYHGCRFGRFEFKLGKMIYIFYSYMNDYFVFIFFFVRISMFLSRFKLWQYSIIRNFFSFFPNRVQLLFHRHAKLIRGLNRLFLILYRGCRFGRFELRLGKIIYIFHSIMNDYFVFIFFLLEFPCS